MHSHLALDLLFCIVLVSHCIHAHSTQRQSNLRNPNGNIFNLLLGLYKLNPLKSSKVYKTFSEDMLQGRGNKSHLVLNLESDEYAKEQLKSNLYEIEKIIHTKFVKPHSHFEKPEYDINDISTENFKVDIVLNDKMLSKELMKMKEKEDFGAIFEHVGSNETYENDVPATKLLPIQNIQYQNPLVLDQAVNEFELISNDGNFKIPTSTLVKVDDNNQEDSSVDLRFDKVPDVVVI